MELRNFFYQVQQPGKTFDDFLISLRVLAKTYKFCSDRYMEKIIHDQIIEGVHDIETIEELLQENNLTLTTAIAKCHSK